MANQILYGFHNLKDLMAERVNTVGIEVVSNAINAAVVEHNRQIDSVMDFFVTRTTDYSRRFRSVTAARLQPLDNNGRALPIKPSGYYDIAFPLQFAGSAWGADYVTGIKMTVDEAQRATNTLIMADARWMRDHILAALYTNVTWTFNDELYGALTVQPLANADAVTYQIISGGDLGATSQHFLAQAAAIADATNPYPTIYSTLIQHPENGGQVVAFIPNSLVATTQALASFIPVSDPNVNPGPGSTAEQLVGTLGGSLPGNLLGYADGVWIVEWRALPADYIIATTTGGDRPLAMREDPEPELRGFHQVATREDHPFYERQYIRRAGFGANNRVGALVYRIGNGTYAIPTNYGSPMS